MSNWYQNLDYKLISDHVKLKITISQILVAAKRLWRLSEILYFCLPLPLLSIHVHFICDPCPRSTYVRSSELPYPLSKMIYYDNNKNIYKSQKKGWKNSDRFDPTHFVRFLLLFKRTHRLPLHNEGWTLYSKISEKHIDVLRKNKEEMEGVHDNASTFMHLNIKAHK